MLHLVVGVRNLRHRQRGHRLDGRVQRHLRVPTGPRTRPQRDRKRINRQLSRIGSSLHIDLHRIPIQWYWKEKKRRVSINGIDRRLLYHLAIRRKRSFNLFGPLCNRRNHRNHNSSSLLNRNRSIAPKRRLRGERARGRLIRHRLSRHFRHVSPLDSRGFILRRFIFGTGFAIRILDAGKSELFGNSRS